MKELITAAFSHCGIAVIDIISPCVTFHNHDESLHSYVYGKAHDTPLHGITYVPAREEITIDDFEQGSVREVELFDGSRLMLKKLESDYDPSNRWRALAMMDEAEKSGILLTGLIYVNTEQPSMYDLYNLPDEALNRMSSDRLRPSRESIDSLNASMF